MHKFHMNYATAISLALGVSALAVGGAFAAEPPASKTAKVSLTGLDLSTTAGMESARQLVEQTSRKLCGSFYEELDVSHTAHYLKCVDLALTESMTRLDALAGRTSSASKLVLNQER